MQRVKDIISLATVKTWESNVIHLIDAGTGSGKTTFIKDVLIDYCRGKNKSLLFLVNRTALRDQTYKDIKKQKQQNQQQKQERIITLASYQALTKKLMWNKKYPNETKLIMQYDYIVCDETHYFFSDALFNNQTDLTLDWLMNNNSIKILMTATASLPKKYIKEVLQKKIIEYMLLTDYNQFISTIYMYDNDKAINQVLFNLPVGEKAIYFCGAEKAYKISKLLKDSSFYCSKSNDLYKFVDLDTYKNIIDNSKFDSQILCTTSVLDNGVNFCDPSLKHIIIDYIDLDEIQQFIGRKRIADNSDKITLYIKNWNNGNLNRRLNSKNFEFEQPEYLKENGDIKFTKEFYKNTIFKKSINTIVGEDNQIHHKVNEMYYIKIKNEIETIEQMIRRNNGYKYAVINRLRYDKTNVIDLDIEFDGLLLSNYLDSLVGKKLFKEEQQKLKDFLTINDDLFNPAKPNHKSLGYNLINGYFKEKNLTYIIKSERENSRKSHYYRNTYWIIGEINFAPKITSI